MMAEAGIRHLNQKSQKAVKEESGKELVHSNTSFLSCPPRGWLSQGKKKIFRIYLKKVLTKRLKYGSLYKLTVPEYVLMRV